MEKKKVWSMPIHIGFNQINSQGRIHLHSIFNYIQEAAWTHAENLGFGYSYVQKYNKAFVLFQVDVIINELPYCNQEIELESWPSALRRVFAERELLLKDNNGQVLIKSSSQWLLIDIEKRKAVRPEILEQFSSWMSGNKLIPQQRVPFAKDTILIQEQKHQAQYSEIDVNGHVNTSRYLEWIQNIANDHISLESGDHFSINFLNECKLGEIVNISLSQKDSTYYIKGEIDGKKIFLASLKKAN